MSTSLQMLVLPGDGIGPEIMAEALKVANWLQANAALDLEIVERPIGGAAYTQEGLALPPATLDLARNADAILLGCVGTPELDHHPERPAQPGYALWYLRKELDLPINLRPIRMRDMLVPASTLKPEVVRGTDFIFVRELTEGLYYGEPRGYDVEDGKMARAFNTMYQTRDTVRRVAQAAFELARRRRGEVCSVEKSNVLEVGRFWREIVTELHAERYGDVVLRHMFVDNAAMQIVRNPRQFDVVLTENLFGDILSDAAAMTTGSIGTLPSAALSYIGAKGERVKGLYEPIHGTAPDIAGQQKATPSAAS